MADPAMVALAAAAAKVAVVRQLLRPAAGAAVALVQPQYQLQRHQQQQQGRLMCVLPAGLMVVMCVPAAAEDPATAAVEAAFISSLGRWHKLHSSSSGSNSLV
jgi:hypothetical protein